MSAPEEGKPHRETRHREDKPSKRRHPHGKRHQADADSRPITEADLDSEASSLQDDDDLVESLSRSSSRRTASSRNQPAQLAPGGPPPPTPITTKALSPANQAQTVPKATQQAYQPSGPLPRLRFTSLSLRRTTQVIAPLPRRRTVLPEPRHVPPRQVALQRRGPQCLPQPQLILILRKKQQR